MLHLVGQLLIFHWVKTGVASAWLRFKWAWNIRITAYGLESIDCSGMPPPRVSHVHKNSHLDSVLSHSNAVYNYDLYCNIYFNNILLDMVSPKYFFFLPSTINKFCIHSWTPDTCYMFRPSSLYQLKHSSPQSAFLPPNITWQTATPVPSHTHTTRTDLHIHRHCRLVGSGTVEACVAVNIKPCQRAPENVCLLLWRIWACLTRIKLSTGVFGQITSVSWNVVGEITKRCFWYLCLFEMIILKWVALGCGVVECGVWCVVLRDSEMNIRVP